jgi:hypothetical protein
VTKNVIAPSNQRNNPRTPGKGKSGLFGTFWCFFWSFEFVRISDFALRIFCPWRPLRLCARYSFSGLFLIPKFQISLARFLPPRLAKLRASRGTARALSNQTPGQEEEIRLSRALRYCGQTRSAIEIDALRKKRCPARIVPKELLRWLRLP